MTPRRCSRLIRLALAACLAVVTTMPPAMGHAHAGGDRPHQHDHDGHHHGDYQAARPPAVSAGWGSSGAVQSAHVHFAWLGLELTFAWPVGSASTGDGAEHIVVRLLDSAAQAGGHFAVQSPLAAAGPWLCPPESACCSVPPRLAALLRSLLAEAPATTLLCDSARHERSGVQLS